MIINDFSLILKVAACAKRKVRCILICQFLIAIEGLIYGKLLF